MRSHLSIAAMAVLGLALVACDSSPTSPSQDLSGIQLRIAHFSPDAPAVDVIVNGQTVLRGVPFSAISEYIEVRSTDVQVQVTPAGSPDAIVIDVTLNDLPNRGRFTAAATGLLSAGDLQPVALEDTIRTSASFARLRFAHMSPDAPAVDIALASGDVLFANASFRDVANYLEVPPGTYDLEVRLAGTDTVVLPLRGITVSAGSNLTAYAIGLVADGSLTATIAVDS